MEQKITCPICFSEDKCFEDVQEQDGNSFSSYICFKCGFTSNSTYKWDSNELKQAQLGATQLMNDVSLLDEERGVMWFPSVVNMGELGVIYPEGTKDNWNWKFAQVRKLSPTELLDEKYGGHTRALDVDNAKQYGQYEFIDACKEMGIIKEID